MADDDATKADDAATTEQQPAGDAAAADASKEPNEPKEPKKPKEPKERRTLAVPGWAAGVLAALLLLGAGFAIGRVSNDGGGGHDRHELVGQRGPDNQGGQENQGGQQDQGGQQNRQFPPLPRRQQQLPRPANGAFLGVQVADASGNQSGASVAAVESGSPAEAAGFKQGDVIKAVDGQSVNSAVQLAARISAHSSGDKVTITLTSNGNSRDVVVTLGSRSNSNPPNLPGLPNGGSNPPSAPGLPGSGQAAY